MNECWGIPIEVIEKNKFIQMQTNIRIKTSLYDSWVVHTYPYKYPCHIIELNSINIIKVCEVLLNTCFLHRNNIYRNVNVIKRKSNPIRKRTINR